jgi:hypothetical protein
MLLWLREVLRFVPLRCDLLRLRLAELREWWELERFSLWVDLANNAEPVPTPRASARKLVRKNFMHYECTAGAKDRIPITRW